MQTTGTKSKTAKGGVKEVAAVKAPVNPLAECEHQISTYFSKLIYAAIEDIRKVWEGEDPFNPAAWQYYANFIRDKKDESKKAKLLPVFLLSPALVQILTKLFWKLIMEARTVTDFIAEMDGAAVVSAIEDASIECRSQFMFSYAAQYGDSTGQFLREAVNASGWFVAFIENRLPMLLKTPRVIVVLWSVYDNFLHAVAWQIARFIWLGGSGKKISKELFFSIMSIGGADFEFLEEMASMITPTVKRKAAVPVPVALAPGGGAPPMITINVSALDEVDAVFT